MSYDSKKLTNEDFRKIFMTPRHPGDSGGSSSATSNAFATPAPVSASVREPGSERKNKDKKKKHFFAKPKKEEDDPLAELSKRYRDRAKERRDGPESERDDLISAQGAYRAMAPDFRGNVDAAERRKQMIHESKYLGGDMEHTHLVKGLDYALLQKVRSELDELNEEEEQREEEEEQQSKSTKDYRRHSAKPEKVKEPPAPPPVDTLGEFQTKLGRNIYRAVFQSAPPERNESFAPGRMAYVMDLEDEFAESDIPHTVMRSKADVPNAEGQATLTTNDIVINKLAQILSYLRQGSKSNKKKKNREVQSAPEPKSQPKDRKSLEEDSIYGNIGDYVPSVSSKSRSHHDRDRDRDHDDRDRGRDRDRGDRREKDRDRDRNRDKERPSNNRYFEKSKEEIEESEMAASANAMLANAQRREREVWNDGEGPKGGDQTFGALLKGDDKSLSRTQKLMSKINSQPEGYAECYPGFDEMHDALDDSDEEIDYSKMDPGKKKGTVGRWDFDTQEEYSEYMSNKEALPKAAFQFGVKMNDGRITRKGAKTEKNEKQQLDKQWQQIQQIMKKRKGESGDGEPTCKSSKAY